MKGQHAIASKLHVQPCDLCPKRIRRVRRNGMSPYNIVSQP